MDLEIWESTASLPLQESADSKNIAISLVGDYGSLLTKIGVTIYMTYLYHYVCLLSISVLSFNFILIFLDLS